MKRNLKNISLLMLLATSSVALMGMEGKVNSEAFKLEPSNENYEKPTVSIAQRANDAANTAIGQIATSASRAYNAMPNVSGRLAQATGYNSQATSDSGTGWNFSSAASNARQGISDFSTRFR